VTFVAATATSECACVLVAANPDVPTSDVKLWESVVALDLSCATIAEIAAKNADLVSLIYQKFQAMFPNSVLAFISLSGTTVKFAIRSNSIEEANNALAFIKGLTSNADVAQLLQSIDQNCKTVGVEVGYGPTAVSAATVIGSNGQGGDIGAASSLIPAFASILVVLAMSMF